MYNLPYHKEKNEEIIHEFIARYPFAFLVGCDADNKPVATQLPIFLEEKNGIKTFSGHLMKNTDHHKAFKQHRDVLIVFSGHHTYVSGTWYSNPHTPSTWNYMSVHVKGVIHFLEDKALIETLRRISLHFENYDQDSATIYDNLPSEYTSKLMQALVAFEIEVSDIDTVFKLSQDRDEKSYLNIIEQLKQQGESGSMIANEMEKRRGELFRGGME